MEIPKEEPKALTKLEIAKNIASIGIGKKEEPKQETLEEAAKRLYPLNYHTGQFNPNNIWKREIFKQGAKWQQERSYSEEDLLGNSENSLDNFLLNSPLHSQEERELIMETVFKWSEQFKKK